MTHTDTNTVKGRHILVDMSLQQHLENVQRQILSKYTLVDLSLRQHFGKCTEANSVKFKHMYVSETNTL